MYTESLTPVANDYLLMITFTCHCGNKLHFENDTCLACGRKLGFLPDSAELSSLEPVEGVRYRALANKHYYRVCQNYHEHQICNWMVEDNDPNTFCCSCRLTEIIPNLALPGNIKRWYRVEKAKRRLLYTLLKLGLPVEGRDINPATGLAFRFLEDVAEAYEFRDDFVQGEQIMTGHLEGTITINLAEAESSTREKNREEMNEAYRTLLGHLRHESGHYYWEKLVHHSSWLVEFHELFGDETRDYASAMAAYYSQGPVADWQTGWISAYASSHPWEDFAETWAHYLHMIDTLETAHDFGFSVRGQDMTAITKLTQFSSGYFYRASIQDLMDDWIKLTASLNALNRSMGLPDAYPFVLSERVITKLDMIHRLVTAYHAENFTG